MALNTIERALLVQAAKVIERGTHIHLCYALGNASHELGGGLHYDAAFRLRHYIHEVLGDYATLDDWIIAREGRRLPFNPEQRRVPTGREERAEARLGWIRWMLKKGKRYDPTATVLVVTRTDEPWPFNTINVRPHPRLLTNPKRVARDLTQPGRVEGKPLTVDEWVQKHNR